MSEDAIVQWLDHPATRAWILTALVKADACPEDASLAADVIHDALLRARRRELRRLRLP